MHKSIESNILAAIFLFRNSEKVHQDQPCTSPPTKMKAWERNTSHEISHQFNNIIHKKKKKNIFKIFLKRTFSLYHHSLSYYSLLHLLKVDVLLMLFPSLHRTGQSNIQNFSHDISLSFSSYRNFTVWYSCPISLHPFH